MATVASRLLRAARNASLASRTAAAAASRASRSARAPAAAAARAARLASASDTVALRDSCPTRGDASGTKPRGRDAPRFCLVEYLSSAEYKRLPVPDGALWAMYECWCKAHNEERDRADMARRFKIFRCNAEDAHHWNSHLPPDPEEAAVLLRKREEVKLLLSKGEDVSHFDEWHLPTELGPFADGGDPFITESNMRLLKEIEETDGSVQ
ncbi:hypothetical protein VPH35_139241 [Triticum aestivum]